MAKIIKQLFMKQVNIFLGGGVALLEGNESQLGYRPTVIDPILSKLNSRRNARRFYIVKTYADLINEYAPEGQQEHYNSFVRKEADIAIFIFDGKVGDKTKEEIENACNSFDKNGYPTIFFYGINLKDEDEVVKYLNSKKQYYRHFSSKEELKQLVYEHLELWKRQKRSRLKITDNIHKTISSQWIKLLQNCHLLKNRIKSVSHYLDSSLCLSKLKNRSIFFISIICILALFLFFIPTKNPSLEVRLGYAEIGKNIDGFCLVKTYSGKYGIIKASEPYDLCADTIYSEYTEMRNSMMWLKQIKDNTWVLFNSDSVQTYFKHREYKKYTTNDKVDSTYIFLFSKEKQLVVSFSDYRESLKDTNHRVAKNAKSLSIKQVNGDDFKIQQEKTENIEEITFRDTLLLDSLNIHFGFINKKGQVIVPPVIDRISEIKDSCAVGRYNGLWGIISFRNKHFPKFEFKNQFWFNGHNHVRVEKNGKWGIIGLNGEQIIKIENDSVGINFSDGLVCVKNNGLCGYKNRKDKYVIPPMYTQAKPFRFGYAAVQDRVTSKWSYVNKNNETLPITIDNMAITKPYFDMAYDFRYSWTDTQDSICLAGVSLNKKEGYVCLSNTKAFILIPCRYDRIYPYYAKRGVFIYEINKKEGIIYNTDVIAPAEYDMIKILDENLFIFKKNDLYGVFDINKKSMIISCAYSEYDYSVLYPNLIRLKKNGKWGCYVINRKKWLGEGIAYTAIYIFNNKIVAEKENGHKIEL